MVQRKELNFEGQNIYIGIDVHLKTWHVSILTESGCLKKHSQQSSAQALFEHLNIIPTVIICPLMRPVSVASPLIIHCWILV